MNWQGVFPAITTPFHEDYSIDHAFLAQHTQTMIDDGCHGIVALGSLGEGATLRFEEKVAILQTLVQTAQIAAQPFPIVAGISSLSTHEAVELAKEAVRVGCSGLMVLPPYVYSTDWREMKAHVAAILGATDLSCMLYNNPLAYRTDFLCEHIAELADEFPNVHAVKESSADIRRLASIRAATGDRLTLAVGVDDVIVEGIAAGATSWVAGLVNAFPRESVRLFELAQSGQSEKAWELYRWFLPLLRLDTVPKFVQLIKLVQSEVQLGRETVRPPRLELVGNERETTLQIIRTALDNRPSL